MLQKERNSDCRSETDKGSWAAMWDAEKREQCVAAGSCPTLGGMSGG